MSDTSPEHRDLMDYVKGAIEKRIAHLEGEMEALQKNATDPRVKRLIRLLKEADSFDELYKLLGDEGL